ncbi:alpha/beta hydrolase [uncultured Chryseobacterium sp.]|uniref:alpha/beta hydrolase n=1 Tax=uncultured Chryseobacterium sp. TaxID=259322 RepID=UPI002622A24A|nr:alpha/beta hydrolase [uncultured Chryseobacterium sp.]
MRHFTIFLSFLVIAIMMGCKKKVLQINKDISFENYVNISYGNDPDQKMDLYIPDNKTEVKDVFILIHGGGWRAGDRSILTSFIFSLMKKFPDCAFANIDYRLASRSRYALPNQTEDIQSAILFLENRLNKNINYILLGNSAGGHLSMLYGYQKDHAKKVKAVINIVGPSDLSDPGFKNYIDYTFVEKYLADPKIIPADVPMAVFVSPISYITQDSAPTLSFYGTYDTVIPLSQKKILDSALQKNGIIHRSIEFNGNHVDWLKETHSDLLVREITEFLNSLKK